jgi:hypothetical protein
MVHLKQQLHMLRMFWFIWAQCFVRTCWNLKKTNYIYLRNPKQFSGESVAIPIQDTAAKAISIPQHWAEEVECGQLTNDDLLCNGTGKPHQQRSPVWCESVLGAKFRSWLIFGGVGFGGVGP